MIDLHCHPLPGIDDGPTSAEQALDMLRAASAAGTRTMVATPHVSTSYPDTRSADVSTGVTKLQAMADAAGIDIRLVAGAEVAILHVDTMDPDDLAGLRLGASRYTLVELPFSATPRFAETLLGVHDHLQPAVLAHPERCVAFHQDATLLARLVGQGMLAQLTAASFTGAYGPVVQRCAWSMLEQGLVHVVASDAHDAVRRPPQLREPLEQVGLGALVQMLCESGPAAVLAGEAPAPAPPVAPPRAVRRSWRLGGLRRKRRT